MSANLTQGETKLIMMFNFSLNACGLVWFGLVSGPHDLDGRGEELIIDWGI